MIITVLILLAILFCFLCYGLGFKKGSEEQHKTDLEVLHKVLSEYHNDNTEKDPYDENYEPVI